MKKAIFLLLIVVLVISNTASAVDHKMFHWDGASYQLQVSGEVPSPARNIYFRGSINNFWLPKDTLHIFFGYVGARMQLSKEWSVSPFVGMASSWMPNGEDAFLASLWNEFKFLDGKITSSVQTDIYANRSQIDYYGYYLLDYNPRSDFNVGANVEQTNHSVAVGPHLGFTKGVFHFEAQYYMNLAGENTGHAIRMVNLLTF